MYEVSAGITTTTPKHSGPRRILTAFVFIMLGSGITYLATNYYLSEQYIQQNKIAYNEGVIKGRQALQAEEQESMREMSGKLLSTTPH